MTMLQYLILLLDDTAASFCHYQNNKKERRLISLDDLKAGILFAMKQNLMIHFVYPPYELPAEYRETIETIDHVKIMPFESRLVADADVIVFNSCQSFLEEMIEAKTNKVLILRADKQELFQSGESLRKSIESIKRLNIVITDIETFTEKDFEIYERWLSDWGNSLAECYRTGKRPQINLLTDRIKLDKMNSCNAGFANITLAPNGKFYVCPAFYNDDEADSAGTPKTGIALKNPQLYRLAYAPLCRLNCDAYQCKRCVWLNRKTTLEVNTPSHEQCVTAHLERNASRNFVNTIKQEGHFSGIEIPEIDFLDPFLAEYKL